MAYVNRTDFVSGPENRSNADQLTVCTVDNTTADPNACNMTGPDGSLGLVIMTYVSVVLYLLICVLGLIGNGLVIYVVLMYAKMKTVTNMYIFNLALSDFLFLIMLPFLATTTIIQHWPFGFAMCKIYFVVYSINLFGGVFNLLLMSADRYLAVCHPISSPNYRTPRNAFFICLCIWSVSFVVMLPVILYSKTAPHNTAGKEVCRIDFPNNPIMDPNTAFIWYCFILGFAVPVSLISVFYILVIIRLRHVGPARKSEEKKKSHKRVTRLVLTVIAVYVMCWLPYWCSQVRMVFMVPPTPEELREKNCRPGSNTALYVTHSFTVLCYANSMLNPFLYAFISDNFRKSFAKAFKCLSTSGMGRHGTTENSVFPRTSQTNVGRSPISNVCEDKMEMMPFTGDNTNSHRNYLGDNVRTLPDVAREKPDGDDPDDDEENDEDDELASLNKNGSEFSKEPVHL